MILSGGLLKVFSLENGSEAGGMPKQELHFEAEHYYGHLNQSYSRKYQAMGAKTQIDALIRINGWHGDYEKMYVILEDGKQYQVDIAQPNTGKDGLPVTDLTLVRQEKTYDINAGKTEEDT